MEVADFLVVIIGGVMSIVVAIFTYKQAKRDKLREKRDEQAKLERKCEMQYLNSVGSMAGATANAVIEHNIGNGAVKATYADYTKKKEALLECYDGHIANDSIKGA